MAHRKGTIPCSCAKALYPVQAIQRNKCNFTRFNKFLIWRFFLNASADHMRPAGL